MVPELLIMIVLPLLVLVVLPVLLIFQQSDNKRDMVTNFIGFYGVVVVLAVAIGVPLYLGMTLPKESMEQIPMAAKMVVSLTWMLGISLGGIFFLGKREREARKKRYLPLADELGMSYDFGNKELLRCVRNYPLLNRGTEQTLGHVLTRTEASTSIQIFEYSFKTFHLGYKRGKDHLFTVALFSHSGISLPEFSLSPKGLWDSLLSALTGKNITFADDRDFNGKCVLKGESEREIRNLFGPDLRRHSLRYHKSFIASTDGVFIYCEERRAPENLKRFLQRGGDIFKQFLVHMNDSDTRVRR